MTKQPGEYERVPELGENGSDSPSPENPEPTEKPEAKASGEYERVPDISPETKRQNPETEKGLQVFKYRIHELSDSLHRLYRILATRDEERLSPIMDESDQIQISVATRKLTEMDNQKELNIDEFCQEITRLLRAVESIGRVRGGGALRENPEMLGILSHQLTKVAEQAELVAHSIQDYAQAEPARPLLSMLASNLGDTRHWIIRRINALDDY